MVLFTGNIPRGVFCEWSAADVTENPRIAARNGAFLPFLCLAKRVTGNGVNSDILMVLFSQREYLKLPDRFPAGKGNRQIGRAHV